MWWLLGFFVLVVGMVWWSVKGLDDTDKALNYDEWTDD